MEGEKEIKKERRESSLIRILSTDIPGEKNVYTGLTRIKGIGWSFSNAICKKLGINKSKRVEDLSKDEIGKIEEFIKNPSVPKFLMNRRFDREEGVDLHKTGSDLDMQKEFDIKRLKQIKAYKGLRHSLGQPVRGQRTRAHFRKNKSVGVAKNSKASKK